MNTCEKVRGRKGWDEKDLYLRLIENKRGLGKGMGTDFPPEDACTWI